MKTYRALGKVTGRGAIASYGEGRVCSARDCETGLSRYNSTDRCSVHERTPDRR